MSDTAEMFPMDGSNWGKGIQAILVAGIPVPLFAAWLASKYILTSVSSTRLLVTILHSDGGNDSGFWQTEL